MTQEEQSKKDNFNGIMTLIGWDYRHISQSTGHTYNSIKEMLGPKKVLPRWCNLFVDLFKVDSLKAHVLQNIRLDDLSKYLGSRIIELSKEEGEESRIEMQSFQKFSDWLLLIRQ